MSELRPKGMKISLGNKEFGIRFNLNVIDEIQDRFDIPIAELGDLLRDERTQVKNIKTLLAIMINEDIDTLNEENGTNEPHITEKYVGRYIDLMNAKDKIAEIFLAIRDSSPESDGPLAESGQ